GEKPMIIPISIDVVSDAVCPWCFIGQKRLDKAIEMAGDVPVTIRWRPYQLDPTIPPEGYQRTAYMAAKFGSEERVRAAQVRVRQAAMDPVVACDIGAIRMSADARDAHRVIRWAGGTGPEMQGQVMRRIFAAFFEEGRDIGRADILIELAGE